MGTRDRPKGHAVYDYAGRIASYEQGCCAWQEAVAAADTPPPPKRVVARDLSGRRTVRGIRLGMAQAAVSTFTAARARIGSKTAPARSCSHT